MFGLKRTATTSTLPDAPSSGSGLEIKGLNCYYGSFHAVNDVNMVIKPRTVTAFIGPSGCGKSTVLRTINRMHETVPGARSTGEILMNGVNLFGPSIDPVDVRRHIGMVFQRPNPFPTMSIRENVLSGLTLNKKKVSKQEADDIVEWALKGANLWDGVSNKLDKPGTDLSGGQQQRLCIARAIAVHPQILLMDEPCSALDPISTLAIEKLIDELKQDYTIVIVTHNMQQAQRVSDYTAFFNTEGVGKPGHLVEMAPTAELFGNPQRPETQKYISGQFG